MHHLKTVLVFIVGIVLLVLVIQLPHVDAVYASVHAIGKRVGQSLPVGNDLSNERRSSQVVRIERVTTRTPPKRMPSSLRQNEVHLAQVWHTGKERPVIVGVILGSCIVSLLIALHTRRDSEIMHEQELGIVLKPGLDLVSTSACIMAMGIIICAGFILFRIFLTGIDDAFFASAIQKQFDGNALYVNGNSTLSMSTPALVLIYIGLCMMMLPVLITVGCRCLGVPSARKLRTVCVLQNKSVHEPFIHRLMFGTFAFCYVLLMLTLLAAPWTTTLFGSLWVS